MGELILVPRIGVTVEEVTITEWLVADGDTVRAGQGIALVETDKTEVELEAPADGTISIEAEPGDVCEVGTVIGEIAPGP